RESARMTGTDPRSAGGSGSVATAGAPTRGNGGHLGAGAVTEGTSNGPADQARRGGGSARSVHEKPPLPTPVLSRGRSGPTGFEPATSWSRNRVDPMRRRPKTS